MLNAAQDIHLPVPAAADHFGGVRYARSSRTEVVSDCLKLNFYEIKNETMSNDIFTEIIPINLDLNI